MRKVEYLSPTSQSIFLEDPRNYYQRYLADTKSSREPQTLPMSVGSAFDAYCKSYLYERFVKGGNDKFAFQTLFESQVEIQNRDTALLAGQQLFELYKSCGAMADLCLELSNCVGKARFELDVKTIISMTSVDGVPILGKPDIFFINEQGAHVILDWKCNGYYANSKTSPTKGYAKLRPGGQMHKGCMPMNVKGITCNVAMPLNQADESWARQLCTYAWLCGEDVGSQTICGIEQLLNRDRVASHRATIERKFQVDTFEAYYNTWKIIQSGWIFRDLTEEASLELQRGFDNPETANPETIFNALTRPR